MSSLILTRAPVGDNQEDYSVLENGVVVGHLQGAGRAARSPLAEGERPQRAAQARAARLVSRRLAVSPSGSRHNHIGGVTPSRPTRHARPCSVPSGCLIAAIKTFAPGLRSLLSPCT